MAPTPSRTKRPHFDTIEEAVAHIGKRVHVAVVLPANLPEGTTVTGAIASRGRGQLGLRLPGPRYLTIQYGVAGFDGCGPLHPRQVTVRGGPAVINDSKLHMSDKRYDGRTYSTLVWPATLKDLEGRYGLSGIFSDERLLAFAESMERARAASPRGPKTKC